MIPEGKHKVSRTLAAGVVAGIMLLAALSLWSVIPLVWLWIGSQFTDSQFPSLGPYLIVLFGAVASILLVAWILGRLNEVYIRLTGARDVGPIRMGWMKSLRDSEKTGDPPSLIEVVIIGSVVIAFVAFVAWFFVLAGSPLPN
ncbi:MAG: hypothetical protein J0H66_06890 [Solirubrobacterales bacterium]|nr:hypothetical protein [Solirubrobacterales bacterium]OJU94108.1 MAG: hypothetical protein BGO23_00025 [Solirubrobacterales bacterium 67-14]